MSMGVVVVVGGPASPDVRAEPLAHAAGAPVWAQIQGEWRAARVAASAQAVLVRHVWAGRGAGVETVAWAQLAGDARTESVPRIDGGRAPLARLSDKDSGTSRSGRLGWVAHRQPGWPWPPPV